MDSKPKTTWLIEYRYCTRSWGPHTSDDNQRGEFDNEHLANVRLIRLRHANKHRDDTTRAETRPCKIWTPDGTWASYRSAATEYRLVKVTREVVDEDKDFDPAQ